MLRWLDIFLGGWRWYRRLRGGRWLDVFHVPSGCGGWSRNDEPSRGEAVFGVEDYRLPRARALSRRH
jgi:hypothetical protein